MQDLSPYFQIVEDCISQLGVDPASCRGQKEGQWNMVRGSAKVWIDVWYIEREGRPYFQVMSPVMRVPATNREAFFHELLQINDRLFGVAFTVYGKEEEWVWLKVIRECDGLEAKEAMAMLSRIGKYADDYDDHLKEKYGIPATSGVGPGAPGAPPL